MLSYDLVDQKERCLMKLLKRILISLLILSTVNLYLPKINFAEQDLIKNPLEIRSTPEEDIPTEKVKKTSGWTWLMVVGMIGGMLAAVSGRGGGGSMGGHGSGGGDDGSGGGDGSSGGGDDGSGGGDGSSDTGDYTITW